MYAMQPIAAAPPATFPASSPLSPLLPLQHIGQAQDRSRRGLDIPATLDALKELRRTFPQVRALGPAGDGMKRTIAGAVADARQVCQRAHDFLLRQPDFSQGGDLGEFSDFRQLLIRDAYLGANAFEGSAARSAKLTDIRTIDACLVTLMANIDDQFVSRTAAVSRNVTAATPGGGRIAIDRQFRHMDPVVRAALMLDLAQEACRPASAWRGVDAVMVDAASLASRIERARWHSNDITDGVAVFDDRIAAAAHALDSDVPNPSPLDDATRTRLLARYRADPAFRERIAGRVLPISLVLTDLASQQAASGRAIVTEKRLADAGLVSRLRDFVGLGSSTAPAAMDAVRGELGTSVASDDAITVTLAFLRATPGWVWPVSVPLGNGDMANLAGTARHTIGFSRAADGSLASNRRQTPRNDFADALFDAMTRSQREALGASSTSRLRLQLQAYALTLDDDALAALLFERNLP